MVLSSAIPELEDAINHGSPERLHQILRQITTLFLNGASRFDKKQLCLFEEVLGALIDKVGTRARAELSESLAAIANAPVEVVRRLAGDEQISVAGPMLERSSQLAESDLLNVVSTNRSAHLLAISRRKDLTEPVIQTLLASTSSEVRAEMRRVLAEGSSKSAGDYRPARATVQALRRQGQLDEAKIIEFARAGYHDEIVASIAEVCAVPTEAVERLLAGERPDPVLVLCKSAGWNWPVAKALIGASPRMGTPTLDRARSDFERLSVATAHRVMRFWQHRRTEDRRKRPQ
jgi:uncharacterized protein (DUF2336 family)